ncbi:MAG: crossover junction endodeoxyribonuclease RuvC [Pseudomonadota bacterium]
MRIIGIDPGLVKTGVGIIDVHGNNLQFVSRETIKPNKNIVLSERLKVLYCGLIEIIEQYQPDSAAIEETFMNNNPASALKLGVARGVAMVAPATKGLEVGEYPANLIKKSVVGAGKCSKEQMGMMIRTLLPSCGEPSEDEADALAVAITHAHHYQSREKFGGILAGAAR